MTSSRTVPLTLPVAGEHVCRGRVVSVHDDGSVKVSLERPGPVEINCDVLQSSDSAALAPNAADRVLVWCDPGGGARGVVLGRIVRARHGAEVPSPDAGERVIEAGQQLVLRCGEASITIQADGKILIKGTDVVSRAKRTNRIKGGAVSIN